MQKYNRKSQTSIRVKSFLNEENLPYQKNNNITDDDIYYFWGSQLTTGTRREVIAYAKRECIKLRKDVTEFIPRSYWAKFEDISKEDLWSINHAVWFVADGYIKDNFEPNSETLLVKEVPEKGFILDVEEDTEGVDVVYNAPTLVPYEFIDYYPFLHYKLDRSNMTELVTSVYERKCLSNIIDFVTVYGYKKIILCGPSDSFYLKLAEDLKKCFPAREISFVADNDNYKKHEPRPSNPKATGIHINLDFDDQSLGYHVPNNLTDDDLYAYWGKKATSGGREKQIVVSKERKEIAALATRDAWINFAKERIASGKWRPIPTEGWMATFDREYLPPIESLQGEDLMLLGHPMWQIAREIINEQFKPNSDIMVVAACSNTKPYIDNPNYTCLRKRMEAGACDVFINSCELWPLNLSPYLHARIYDWSHLRETPFVQEALIHCNFHSIVLQQQRFGYKKIVVYAPCGNPFHPEDISSRFYPMLMDLLHKYYEGTDITVDFVLDEETIKKAMKLAVSWGVLKQRHWVLRPCRSRFDDLINYNGIDRVIYETEEELDKQAEEKQFKKKAKINSSKNWGFNNFEEKEYQSPPLL